MFCLPHNGADRMVFPCNSTEQPVGDVHCVFSQQLERRCPRKVRTRVKFAVARDCARRSVWQPRPRMASSSVSSSHIHNETVFVKSVCTVNRCPARADFLFYHDRCFVDVRRTSVRISRHGIARQEARRLAMWCDRSTMWRSLDLTVVASNTLCASYT